MQNVSLALHRPGQGVKLLDFLASWRTRPLSEWMGPCIPGYVCWPEERGLCTCVIAKLVCLYRSSFIPDKAPSALKMRQAVREETYFPVKFLMKNLDWTRKKQQYTVQCRVNLPCWVSLGIFVSAKFAVKKGIRSPEELWAGGWGVSLWLLYCWPPWLQCHQAYSVLSSPLAPLQKSYLLYSIPPPPPLSLNPGLTVVVINS